VSGDRQSGALKLELQRPLSPAVRISAKALVLLGGWLVASLPVILAILRWKNYGGHIFVPELMAVALGHVLNALLTIGLAAAAAVLTDHPSTAAILTLAVTVGTWIINFIAAVHGGWWERAAGYTPTAMVAQFQHGLIRLDVTLITLVLVGTGLTLSAIWLRLGLSIRRRTLESVTLATVCVVAMVICARVHASWDLSESRSNSFSRVDEVALRQIHAPLRIVARLAPQDPRRVDLEQRALSKLRRVLPALDVQYVSATSIGLFEQTADRYGEIWYELEGRRQMSRSTTAEGVLETIYALARVTGPPEDARDTFRGYPLAVPPKGAAIVFYGIWPVAVVATAVFMLRR
jgi:hypothetical protein